MSQNSRTIIYTDLDGAFLDERNYSFFESLTALRAAQERDIPVVFCSSKTRAEVEHIRKAAEVTDPFIVENGGAIFVPAGYFPFVIEGSAFHEGSEVIEMGEPYAKIIDLFRLCRSEFPGLGVIGFSDMTIKEIALECGLTLAEAQRAKDRKYSEPFRFSNATLEDIRMFLRRIRQAGLRFSAGGRYYHLQGKFDKGISVRILNEMFFRAYGPIKTVGIGDSPNDLPMLNSVEMPIIVKRPSGTHDPGLATQFSGVRLTERIGPSGWSDAVMQLLHENGGE
ncbi:MAG: HAD-IIB family hydrolase [Acidobacteria bacterium]|nr:HAD-IIB family hydrolase [Acidobacteriota bacterium]